MTKKYDYDLIIIGSGVAGVAAAQFAAARGIRVVVIESGKWGGSALNTSDIPERALTSFSHSFIDAESSHAFGVSTSSIRFNLPTFKTWMSRVHRLSGAGSTKLLEDSGVTCIKGIAHFLTPFELSVGKKVLTAPRFIIASGCQPFLGGITGLDACHYLTPENFLNLTRPPKTLAIIGGGSTGCVFAEFFASLGTNVVIFELNPRLLPREDEEIGPVIERSLTQSKHIKILTQSRVVNVSSNSDESRYSISYLRGGLRKTATCEAVFMATGQTPSLDLGLDNTGVKWNEKGIKVDKYLATSMRHIFAAGSCTGSCLPVEYSAYSGALAAANLLTRNRLPAATSGYVRFTNTHLSVASVGLTEEDCLHLNRKFKKSLATLGQISASYTGSEKLGFIKLIVDSSDKLIGATIVAPHADLIIPELALAVRHHLSAMELASTPVVSSSYAELIRVAAKKLIH